MNTFFGFQGSKPKTEEPKQENTGVADLLGSWKKKASKFIDEVKTQVDAVQQVANLSKENTSVSIPVEQCLPKGQDYLRNGNTDKALEVLYQGVRGGSADCALQLYNMYAQGDGVEVEFSKAYFWARMADHLGSVEGTYLAGAFHRDGLGVPEASEFEAYRYFDKAARRGHQEAKNALIEIERKNVIYYDARNGRTDEQLRENAKNAGSERERTLCHIVLAMVNGNDMDKNLVGLRYREGKGVERNYITSICWFKKAIEESGLVFACYNLARMYECGAGVMVDLDEAKRLYQMAAQKGHTFAQERVTAIEELQKLTAANLISKSASSFDTFTLYPRMYYLKLLASQKGSVHGTLLLGHCYREEEGVKRNYVEALICYAKVIMSEDRDHARIAYRLMSTMYALGQGVPENLETANYYYNKARQYGDSSSLEHPSVLAYMESNRSEAMKSLSGQANFYKAGCYCKVDMNKAVDLYKQAASNDGSLSSWFELANIYAYGFCTERSADGMLDYAKAAYDDWKRRDGMICLYGSKPMQFHGTELIIKRLLLQYHNLTEFNRYEAFTAQIAYEAARCAFINESKRLGYAYLDIAKELGADISPLIEQYGPRDAVRSTQPQQSVEEQQNEPEVWRPTIHRRDRERIDTIWQPEIVTEEQIGEIRELARTDKLEELYWLGVCYYFGRDDREENGRLAATCFKLAAEEGYIGAVLAYADLSLGADGGAIPTNFPLCKRMLDRFHNIQLRGELEEAKEFVQKMYDTASKNYYGRLEHERNLNHELIDFDLKKMRDVLAALEQNHFEEEEWLIKEYRSVISDRENARYLNEELFFGAGESDWDCIVEKDWEAYYRHEHVTYNENLQIICDWQPDFITDEQLEEINQLVSANKIKELYELAIAYVDEEVEPERTTNARLAAMCLKHAIDHQHLGALILYARLAVGGHWGFPQNIEAAKYILDKVEEEFDLMYIAKAIYGEEELENALKDIPGESDNKEQEEDKDSPFADIREIIAEIEEENRNMSEEDLKRGIESNQQVADKMAVDHYDGEEWYIHEYYRLADYRRNRNDLSAISDSLPFKDSQLDIDRILAEMKAEYIKNDVRAEKAEGIHLAEEGEERPSELPENLDAYFEGMIGMDSVKTQLNKIYQTVKIQMMREKALRERGIEPKENEKGYNFILLGNPGTGKTTVARIIAKILYDIQIRETDSFIEIERSSIVGSYIGETEKQIAKVLKNVRGGTLFIDEAYTLYKEDSENDVGAIVIDTLMKDMEDHRNSYSVIMAGYREPMLNMVRNANSGFSSRFTYVIELPDYSDEALIEIAHMHMDKQKLVASEGVDEAIVKCIHHDKLDQTFGNARYIRELVNRAIENQSERLNTMETFGTDDLFELRAEDFWQGTMEEEGVEKYLEELNKLTGLSTVKKDVEALIHTITVQQEMEKRGLPVSDSLGTLHMAFKGNPGTGKTTVARIIGKLYASLGILKRGDVFVECTRSDLVGKYQGHTAEKVKKVIESALGGVLFIDEAYSLVQGENDSFGLEAVNELVAEMENKRQNLVIILAGYTDDIDEFLKNNPGLRSRVPKDLFFEDYNMEEMYEIALSMLNGKNLNPTEDAKQAIRARLVVECMRPDFGNARGVRNIVEDIWRKQNVRIANLLKDANAEITNEMMLQVEKDDVLV